MTGDTMSGHELTEVLSSGGTVRIDAAQFSSHELARAARTASIGGALLILYNHAKLTIEDIRGITEAGSRRVIFDDVRLI